MFFLAYREMEGRDKEWREDGREYQRQMAGTTEPRVLKYRRGGWAATSSLVPRLSFSAQKIVWLREWKFSLEKTTSPCSGL